jgi:UDP-N-acetylmuramoyl-tripeptide--D-alanyl-D-alanine ligase
VAVSGPGGPWLSATAWTDRFHTGVSWITVACCVVALVPAGLRWLRVAQREHYLAGSAARFAARWWRMTVPNLALATVAVVAAVLSLVWPVVGVAVAAVAVVGPLGLTLRGRTSPLAWTRRLRTLAVVWGVLEIVVVVVGIVVGLAAPAAVVALLAVPVLVDAACALTAPVEGRLAGHFVDEAVARLALVHPTVVAITGSYGKTSTKNHVAHLVRPTLSVVATPASFNNQAGLARAVNEQLADGTQVFVAEMGTYGPGEIADLCRWCPPDIAVITAIGPVHLERFGSEERIVEAKSEILTAAADVVLQVDDPRLAAVADRAADTGQRVMRCSAVDRGADVCVVRSPDGTRITAYLGGSVLAQDVELAAGVQPTNLACALAVAVLLGVDRDALAARLATLPSVDHRLAAVGSASGAAILDDTYNSNPAGASEALTALVATASATPTGAPAGDSSRRLVVVTPGMVELGLRQREANADFGAAIAAVATDVVIVGRTNRRALLAGMARVAAPDLRVVLVAHREAAVEWVRHQLGPGDVVLYENDLPDHYP